ncbi:hypothetical protein LOTGIDRAFT_160278 [Lottia gigantea]|uniref:Ig-like domain-containing protein n=1 Tax=Lottia gigantea TaxID=225164 RepID=V4AQ02_LOTGI|nr:hypothetical protein LOTGIDRAFT_160278 [Lottia gigantea]ESO95731.1 hypothetical protein LOTGIDRAFT_160278 [Lottia gigantea]
MAYQYFMMYFGVAFILFGISTAAYTSIHQHCPTNCICDIKSFSIGCTGTYNSEIQAPSEHLHTYFEVHRVNKFSLHRSISDLNVLKNLPAGGVQILNVSDNSLHEITFGHVVNFDNVVSLDLSRNLIDSIEASAFYFISDKLQALNISFNLLNTIPVDAFKNLESLRSLILRNNRLESLPTTIFHDLNNLETLDLSFNKLSFLSSNHFEVLSNLQTLYLNNNMFRTFHADVIPSLSLIPSIDVSFNPFECSCAVHPLVNMIKDSSANLISADDTACISPDYYQGRLLQDVDIENLNCSHPVIVGISSDQTVLHFTDLMLSCDVTGYPNPSVVWFTPWGTVFSHHTSHHLIGDHAVHHSVTYSYLGQKLFVTTTVSALANGSLHIDKFRGFFSGNYKCLAFTPVGNVSASTSVQIYSAFQKVYIESLIWGGITAAGFLVFGIIVAIVITTIRRLCCPNFFMVEEKQKIPEIIIVPASECSSVCLSDKEDDFDHPPEAVLTNPVTDSSSVESEKLYSPPESPPQGWLSSNMIESIGEVKSKLRYGMGRKIETVRSHTKAIKDSGVKKYETVRSTVKTMKDTGEKRMERKIETIRTNVRSFKDSGTVYMQSIKDTSSHAAHKVRAGVVMSVETMKYTVQSMKELCGTGEMGGGTISMVSMETDIDSNESKEVLRSVTYV